MSATLDFFGFIPSQKYLDTPDALKAALEADRPEHKALRTFYGVQLEEPTIVWIALIWDSTPEATIDLVGKGWQSLVKQLTTSFRVQINKEVAKAFGAPVTEVCLATTKKPENKKLFSDTIDVIIPKFMDVYGPAYGEVTAPGTYDIALFIGWNSREAHLAAVKDNAEVAKLFEYADLHLVHVPFESLA